MNQRTSDNGAPADEANGRCPECDAPSAWQVSRRHRFSPFGAVLLAVFAFWSAVAGWFLGYGYVPSVVLIVLAVITGSATRRAEICQSCGYVRPQGA